jgi:hypothetical protein
MKSAVLAAMFLPALAFSVSCSLEEPAPVAAGGAGGTGGSGTSSGGSGATGGSGSSTTGAGGTSAGAGGTSGGSAGTGNNTGGTSGGAGGTSGGSGGTTGGGGGTTGGAGGSGGGSLIDLAATLDQQKYTLPCGPIAYSGTERVCCNHPGGSATEGVCNNQCPGNPDLALTGFQNKNETINFGGTAGTTYAVKLRVRGIVEPKHYDNCPKQVEGFCGGPNAVPAEAGAYNVYMIQVKNAGGTVRYFLNALDENEEHSAFALDYEATIDVDGGAELVLVAADENCTAIKNCADDGSNDLTCNPITHPDLADHPEIVQPYNGQFVVIDVLDVTQK